MPGFRLAVLAQSALLAGCAAFVAVPVPVDPPGSVAYSALQIIDTTPGPFQGRIYVSGDRERQDALLGGGLVTTIIRRDRGVAWLLIPGRLQYEEIALEGAGIVSVQARCADLQRRSVGPAQLDGAATEKFACYDANGREAALVWESAEGIPLQSVVLADPVAGKPQAVIRLEQLRIAPQDPALFELPPGYRKVAGE